MIPTDIRDLVIGYFRPCGSFSLLSIVAQHEFTIWVHHQLIWGKICWLCGLAAVFRLDKELHVLGNVWTLILEKCKNCWVKWFLIRSPLWLQVQTKFISSANSNYWSEMKRFSAAFGNLVALFSLLDNNTLSRLPCNCCVTTYTGYTSGINCVLWLFSTGPTSIWRMWMKRELERKIILATLIWQTCTKCAIRCSVTCARFTAWILPKTPKIDARSFQQKLRWSIGCSRWFICCRPLLFVVDVICKKNYRGFTGRKDLRSEGIDRAVQEIDQYEGRRARTCVSDSGEGALRRSISRPWGLLRSDKRISRQIIVSELKKKRSNDRSARYFIRKGDIVIPSNWFFQTIVCRVIYWFSQISLERAFRICIIRFFHMSSQSGFILVIILFDPSVSQLKIHSFLLGPCFASVAGHACIIFWCPVIIYRR